MVKLANFPVDAEATAVAIAYKNPDHVLIADEVMPRCTPVGQREYSYLYYPPDTFFTMPDDTMGEKGKANEVTTSAKKEASRAEDHGLKITRSKSEIEKAKKNGINLVNTDTGNIFYYVTQIREIRVAKMVGNSDNYANNHVALSGTDMFSHADSKPLDRILYALDVPLMRPNVMTFSQPGWTTVRTHPDTIEKIKGKSGSGAVTKQEVIDYLELQDLYIGASRVNAAKKNQPVNLQACWGNFCALHYRSKQADTENGITWGMTVPKGTRIAGSWPDKEIGLEGGIVTVAGEVIDETVVAPECGYLIENIM